MKDLTDAEASAAALLPIEENLNTMAGQPFTCYVCHQTYGYNEIPQANFHDEQGHLLRVYGGDPITICWLCYVKGFLGEPNVQNWEWAQDHYKKDTK